MVGFEHPLAQAALQETVELHVFFEAWLGGTAPKGALAFARVETALAETFSMVSPDGRRLSRADVLAGLRQSYGARARPFRIAVRDPEVIWLSPPVVILGYVEEQQAGETLTRRRSTAVFTAAASKRPVWTAVHETWIAGDA